MTISNLFIAAFQSALKNDIVIKDIYFDDDNIEFFTYNLDNVYSQTYVYNIKLNDIITINGYNDTKKQQQIVKRLAKLIIKYKTYAKKNMQTYIDYYYNIQKQIFDLKYSFNITTKINDLINKNKFIEV